MTFKAYDILSSLVPGFLLLIAGLNTFGIYFDKDLIVPYTAVAFLLGFLNNTISSWLEDLYFWTWGGKPSNKLLDGKSVWKVPFYHSAKTKNLLIADCPNQSPSNDELFSIAMRKSNGQERVDNFNAMYAFSRALLTTVLIATIFLLITHYTEWQYYALTIPVFIVLWLRTKQRGYYYAREVLNTYLKQKES
ncbi:MAG TPA: hypothetical protein VIJ75_00365 [Hanamia sp.]